MANAARPQIQRERRNAKKGVDLAVGEKFYRWPCGIADPDNVFARVETDIGCHDGEELLFASAGAEHPYSFALQIGNAADALVPETFNAPCMYPAHHRDRIPGIDAG